jgi:DNA-binding transcriptional LysR family regulator
METLTSLTAIDCFVRSADAGSFAAAARGMGLTPAAVGKNIAKLERSLGVQLFARSTRSLALTEPGRRFLGDVREGLVRIQSALAVVAGVDGQPAGTLKVSMGTVFGRAYVMPQLGEFLARYPAIAPDWHFENRAVDLIREGYDAAIGGSIELSAGLVARKLAPAHRVLVATKAFLRARGVVRTPADLARLDGILVRSPQSGRVRPWALRNRAGDEAAILLEPRMTMSDPDASCRAATMDLGVALVSMPHALPFLDDGSLVRVLPDWYVDGGNLSIYYAAQGMLPAKTRAFVDFVVADFKRQKLARRFSAI